MNDEWQTRQSLLMRVKDPSDPEAWEDFVKYYEKFIYHLLHRMDISVNDFNDLVQEILIKLWKSLKSYDARGGAKFRSWLAAVVRNAVYDYFLGEERKRKLLKKAPEIIESLHDGQNSELQKMVEKEWKIYITNLALERISRIFSESAVKVFACSLEGMSAEEISSRLDLGIDSVYTLKNRVKARFIKEVHSIIQDVEF